MALTTDNHRIWIPNLQLIHGRVQVKWRCWSYLLCGLLLLCPRSAVLLPASIRDNPTRVSQPGPHKNGRVVTHHVAHCCVLIQGGSNYATPCAGAGVGNGRSNCAGWFLCFLHPPRESRPAGPPKTITRYKSHLFLALVSQMELIMHDLFENSCCIQMIHQQ